MDLKTVSLFSTHCIACGQDSGRKEGEEVTEIAVLPSVNSCKLRLIETIKCDLWFRCIFRRQLRVGEEWRVLLAPECRTVMYKVTK